MNEIEKKIEQDQCHPFIKRNVDIERKIQLSFIYRTKILESKKIIHDSRLHKL